VIAIAPTEPDAHQRAVRTRQLVMAEHLMAIADELIESLALSGVGFDCPRHRRDEDKRPTLCAICSLVFCRGLLKPVRALRIQ
jgi:hypothetical protein